MLGVVRFRVTPHAARTRVLVAKLTARHTNHNSFATQRGKRGDEESSSRRGSECRPNSGLFHARCSCALRPSRGTGQVGRARRSDGQAGSTESSKSCRSFKRTWPAPWQEQAFKKVANQRDSWAGQAESDAFSTFDQAEESRRKLMSCRSEKR